MSYSPEEIKGFQEKDLRINKVAVIKSLIESGRNSANEVEENCMIVEQYVKFIYNVIETKEQTKSGTNAKKVINYSLWDKVTKDNGLPIPNESEKKILNILWDEYKNKCSNGIKPEDLHPVKLCGKIIKAFGKYPTSKNSISKVMKAINVNQILDY